MRGLGIILLANASMRASNHVSCASVTIPGHVTLAQARKCVTAVEQKRMTEAAMAKLGSV